MTLLARRRKRDAGNAAAPDDKAPSDAKKPLRRVLMNIVDSGQMRVAITGPGGLEELYIERSDQGFSH